MRYRCSMDTLRLFITGPYSTQLMRMARIGEVVTAVTAQDTHVTPLDRSIQSLDDVGLGELASALKLSPGKPLTLLVPNDASRRWSKTGNGTLQTSVLSPEVPSGSFLELKDGAHDEKRIHIPSGVSVFIKSPALAVLDAVKAYRLANKDDLEVFHRVLAFADECCGSYIRDPTDPATGTVTYDERDHCTRFCSPEELREVLNEAHDLNGLKLARHIARYIIDESGSPMETCSNHALTLPPRYGGLSMRVPLANKQLVLDSRERAIIRHNSLRPDFQWPDFRMLAEYLGDESHSGKEARVEDKNRLQDYSATSYTTYFLMYDDVCNAAAINRTAEMFAREFMKRGLKGELYRVRRHLRDEDFRARQRLLLAHMLPPLRRY